MDTLCSLLQSDNAELLKYVIASIGYMCNYGRELMGPTSEVNPVVRKLRV